MHKNRQQKSADVVIVFFSNINLPNVTLGEAYDWAKSPRREQSGNWGCSRALSHRMGQTVNIF